MRSAVRQASVKDQNYGFDTTGFSHVAFQLLPGYYTEFPGRDTTASGESCLH
jgi:hypothetical protein